MIEFRYPELFLLIVPVGILFYRIGWVRGVTGYLRAFLLLVLITTLTVPMINLGGRGIDVIVVADRSRSMPADAGDNIQELIRNLQNNRGTGDRIGIVTFGASPAVESLPRQEGVLEEYAFRILPDGSDLNSALETALSLVDQTRPTRLLVLSDGEANGVNPTYAARKAREDRIPIDVRAFERLRIGDVAIDSLNMPESVAPREPFQFPVWIYSDRSVQGELTLQREGVEFAKQTVNLDIGANRILFRDVIDQAGFFNYTAELTVADDPLQENNVGVGVVRVDAGPRLLVLNNDGQEDNLTRALRAGRIDLDVVAALDHPLTQDSLDEYRAVILENVPARYLGRLKMERLAQFTEDMGGGLMLTGGERSFGTGGYFKSALDETIPVSMEMREEHRKNRMALAVALDRSGSMSVPVKGSQTKMDLANIGTVECVNMLSAGDSISVIAVDSQPHVVQPMIDLTDKDPIISRIKKIESMGGGIFVYEALVAAGNELVKSSQSTKHIILFSDAADSEQPGNYKSLLKKYEGLGITVSVIGLGSDTDPDAQLLKDIAKLGSGNIMFTNDPEELPRLFTEDTMSVARSTFVTKDETQPNGIPGAILPDAQLLGELDSGGFPNVDGYNLSYIKPDATPVVVTQDEYTAPLSAVWYRGIGRAAALCLEVDGQYTGQFGRWENYEDFLITHARWLMSGHSPDEVYVDVERIGQDAVVRVELDPERTDPANTQPPILSVIPPGEGREAVVTPEFLWTGPNSLEARFTLDRTGSFRTIVENGGRQFTRGPAVSLPYSPEFAPRAGLPSGLDILKDVAETSGGIARTDVLSILDDPPRAASKKTLLPWLFSLSILLLIAEIAGRRLSLWERLKPVSTSATAEIEEAKSRQPRGSWWSSWIPKLPKRAPKPKVSESDTKPQPPTPTPPAEQPDEQADQRKKDVFAAAKARAKKRR
ncbi:MAG: VWA domain-containing protein [Planctomycetaceae bacterium]|nr:VWA domain-containing protein [Planctomycetaceae bacterium]